MSYSQENRKTCLDTVVELAKAQPLIFSGIDAVTAAKALVESAKILENYINAPDSDAKLRASVMR